MTPCPGARVRQPPCPRRPQVGDRVEYTDALGTLDIDAEWSPGRGVRVMAFTSRVPDEAHRRREDVFLNLARAFDAAGWHLKVLE